MSTLDFKDTISREIETTLTKKPNTPQIKIENPLAGSLFVNGIDVLFDTLFSRNGELVIEISDVIVYDSRTGKTKNLGKITVGVGKVMKVDDKIKIFAWNKINNDIINAEFKIGLGKIFEPFTAQTILQNVDVINKFNSESEILFENEIRGIGEFFKLLDMKGYKKLIVNMPASNYVSPIVVENFDNFTFTDLSIDGNLDTSGGQKDSGGACSGSFELVVDFGSILVRSPKTKIRNQTQVNTGTVIQTATLSVSNLQSSGFVDIASQISSGTLDITTTLIGLEQSFRYMKIKFSFTKTIDCNNLARSTIFEMYDSNELGGTASLSFEELDILNNTFSELISASEFGTVTAGEKIKTQIGDVSNVSISGNTYFLPSTQKGFRAKLTISGDGGIETGVSIRKIS